MKTDASKTGRDFDVAVVGGSISGTATALQILRKKPGTRLCIIEKTDNFTRRVGESTVEVSGFFLGKYLGLSDHLNRKHLAKQGLRFHFAGEETNHLADCGEIGPRYNVRMPSYQVDRSVLDSELLRLAEAEGAVLFRKWSVREVELEEGGAQKLHCRTGTGETEVLQAKWIVDASGRATLIGRKLNLIRPNEEHPISSIWARFTGVPNWESLGRKRGNSGWAERTHGTRDTATNHLMGDGYWIWVISLAGGETSIGVVYDERLYSPPGNGSLAERLLQVIAGHPAGRELLEGAEICEGDLHYRRKLAYFSEQYAGNGWALVGDAGAFLDPFYSPGLDWIAFSSSAAARLVLSGLKDSFIEKRIDRHNRNFTESYRRWFEAIYKDKYQYMGDLDLMDEAFRSDLGHYYAGVVQPLLGTKAKNWNRPPFSHPEAARIAEKLARQNARLVAIAGNRRRRGEFGQNNHRRFRPFESYRFGWHLRARLGFLGFRRARLEAKEKLHMIRKLASRRARPAPVPETALPATEKKS